MIIKRLPQTIFIFLFILFSISTCSPLPEDTPTVSTVESVLPTEQPELEMTQSSVTEETVEEGQGLLITNTPQPTATPGVVTELVEEIIQSTRINQNRFLGLTIEDWTNLGISLLVFLTILFILGNFVTSGLYKLVRKTPSEFDNLFFVSIKPQIRWLAGILGLYLATIRLQFLTPVLKQFLIQVYFGLVVMTIAIMLWKAVDIGGQWYRKKVEEQSKVVNTDTVLVLVQRVLRFIIFVTSLLVILQRYGINVSGLLTALGIGGLALSLAAQDTLGNMISGIIILMDQPFRIGDQIQIQGLDTWGEVVDIGLRTTRIRTPDNRMVIVPNSNISKSQVINYTYPDPRCRLQIEIGVPYGSDLEKVRQVITQAVRKVDGVIAEKPVDVHFKEVGSSSMTLQINWWIESNVDSRSSFDKINESIYHALSQVGIEMHKPG